MKRAQVLENQASLQSLQGSQWLQKMRAQPLKAECFFFCVIFVIFILKTSIYYNINIIDNISLEVAKKEDECRPGADPSVWIRSVPPSTRRTSWPWTWPRPSTRRRQTRTAKSVSTMLNSEIWQKARGQNDEDAKMINLFQGHHSSWHEKFVHYWHQESIENIQKKKRGKVFDTVKIKKKKKNCQEGKGRKASGKDKVAKYLSMPRDIGIKKNDQETKIRPRKKKFLILLT